MEKRGSMNISRARHIGSRHREVGENNQDYVAVKRIRKDIAVAVLADGAGSKRHGGKTAEYLVKCVEEYCVDNACKDEFLHNITSNMFTYVNKKILNMIKDEKGLLEDYGSTMIFVVVCEGKYVAGHIGDGVILFNNLSDFKVLSLPDNGEYINQTYFVPTEIDQSHFRLYEGELKDEFCFILASDGIAGTLFDQADNRVSSACEQIYRWCKKYSSDECNRILKENLVKVFDKYSDDDKSIAIICDSID